jgi:hypothetical protein
MSDAGVGRVAERMMDAFLAWVRCQQQRDVLLLALAVIDEALGCLERGYPLLEDDRQRAYAAAQWWYDAAAGRGFEARAAMFALACARVCPET